MCKNAFEKEKIAINELERSLQPISLEMSDTNSLSLDFISFVVTGDSP